MDGSGPKWDNPLSNIIGVSSLRLGGFHIVPLIKNGLQLILINEIVYWICAINKKKQENKNWSKN